MATVTLDQDRVNITDLSIRLQTQRYSSQSASLVNTAVSNGAARHIARMELTAGSDEDRMYLEGVLLAAEYNFDDIQFRLPPEFYRYIGDGTVDNIQITTDVVAGSNTINLRRGTSGTTRPTSTDLYQGAILQFEDDTTIYRINQYNASSGNATIFPLLRRGLSSGDTVSYLQPTFTGNITNTLSVDYRQGINGYATYEVTLEETL